MVDKDDALLSELLSLGDSPSMPSEAPTDSPDMGSQPAAPVAPMAPVEPPLGGTPLPTTAGDVIEKAVGEKGARDTLSEIGAIFGQARTKVRGFLGLPEDGEESSPFELMNPAAQLMAEYGVSKAQDGGFGEMGKSLVRGFTGAKKMVGEGIEQYGKTVGSEAVSEFGAQTSKDGAAVAENKFLKPRIETFRDIRSEAWIGDTADYLTSKLGEGVGNIAGIAAFYQVGGAAGSAGFLATMSIGEVREGLKEAGITDETKIAPYAYGAGLAIAALEAVFPAHVLKELTAPAKRAIAEHVARTFVKGAWGGMWREGITEGLQEATQIAAVAHAKDAVSFFDSKPILDALTSGENVDRILEAMISGAVPGATIGGVTSGAQARRAPRPGTDTEKRPEEKDESFRPGPDQGVETVRDVSPSLDPNVEPGRAGGIRVPRAPDPVIDEARAVIDGLAPAQPVAAAPTAPTAPAQIPTFAQVLDVLPKDEAGDPDIGRMMEGLSEFGAKAWGGLTPEQKTSLFRRFAPVVEQAAAEAGPVVEKIAEAVASGDIAGAVQQAAEAVKAVSTRSDTEASAALPRPAATVRTDSELRAAFDKMLGTNTKRGQWADTLQIDQAQLDKLVAEGLKDGRLKLTKAGAIRRTGKASASQPAPAAIPAAMTGQTTGQPATASPAAVPATMDRATEVRLERSKNDVARRVAQQLAEASSPEDLAQTMKRVRSSSKAKKADLAEIVKILSGRKPKGTTKAALIDEVEAVAAERQAITTATEETTQEASTFDPAQHIRLVADDISKVRKSDIDRLFREAPRTRDAWTDLRVFIAQNRTDLIAEALDVIGDLGGLPKTDEEIRSAERAASNREERAALNRRIVPFIQDYLRNGGKVQSTTVYRITLLSKPEHIRLAKDGTVQIPERSKWVSLFDSGVDDLARQAGWKATPASASGSQQLDLVEMTKVGAQASARKAVRRETKPVSLIGFLRARGGINDEGGDLRAMAAHKRPGLVNYRNGLTLDHAREIAAEAGYLKESDVGIAQTSTADLLEAIADELSGRPTYSTADLGRVAEMQEELAAEIADGQRSTYVDELQAWHEANDLSFRMNESEIDRAAAMMSDGVDIETAVEAAFIETVENETNAGTVSEDGLGSEAEGIVSTFDDGAVAAGGSRREGGRVRQIEGQTSLEAEGVGASAADRNTGLERDWRDGPPQDGLGQADVPAASGRDGEGAGARGEGPVAQGSPDGGLGLFDGDAPSMGEGGDSQVQDGAPGDAGRAAGSGERAGSGDAGERGVPAGRAPAEAVGKTSANASPLVQAIEAQRIADATTPFIENDPENIRASLPLLKPSQRDDVVKAEARFSQPDGFGFLFTNGTGTGKTFTGLGVIKRFVKQGKSNVLILAPSQGILDGWVTSGRMIGLDITRLADTSTAGDGIVATTYANLRENNDLVKRRWDLLVADEAHHLSQNASGNPSDALSAFRGLSNQSPGARARMLYADDAQRIAAMREDEKAGRVTAAAVREALSAYDANVTAAREQFAAEPRSKALFLSATPFAYRKSTDWAEGFLFSYPETKGRYNDPGGQAEFLVRNFGYNMRYNRAEEPGPEVNVGVLEREFYERLKREGVLSGRRLEVDADYDRRFVLVDDAVGAKIDQAMNWLSTEANGRYYPLAEKFREKFNYLAQRRLLEAIKAKHAIPRIKEDLGLGRKVVVFHDYNEGGGLDAFAAPDNPNERVRAPYGEQAPTIGELYHEFIRANPYVKKLNFAQFDSPIVTLTRAFPEAFVYNGRVPNKQRARARDEFNRDGSGRDIIIVQSAAGEAGISLHDTTGKHQRVLYNLGLPTRPTTAIQQEGRIYREGQVSDAILRYMSTGTGWERTAFSQTIAERASTAENLALGDEARALRDAFIDAFNEADEIAPSVEEGKGGKQRDRTMGGSATPWERAKAFYFAEGKKRGRRDQREGTDYYATPEPIGLKMVEFADAMIGERILEPSAGHGAIARWFPEGANRFVIEPSASLASRAGLASPGAKVIVGRFEDHYVGNKYDAIVMNPPFGSGGKDAFDHIQKAVTHLRDGGRVVAIVPRGGMADRRWDSFRDNDANKSIYTAMEVELPTVMFERAGTKVATRLLVLEKHSSVDRAPQTVYRDLSNAETINELFDRIEGLTIGPRSRSGEAAQRTPVVLPVSAQPAPAAQTLPQPEEVVAASVEAADDASTETAEETPAPTPTGPSVKFTLGEAVHGKTGADLFVASIAQFVPRPTYESLRDIAKKHGGYYSTFRGRGAIPGFQFPSEAKRTAFLQEAAGTPETEAQQTTGTEPERRVTPALPDSEGGVQAAIKSADEIAKAKRSYEFIRKQVLAGKRVPISEDVTNAFLDAAWPHSDLVPSGAQVAALSAVRPPTAAEKVISPWADVVGEFRSLDGTILTTALSLDKIDGYRGGYDRRNGAIIFFGLSRADVDGLSETVVRSRVAHEAVHAVWKSLPRSAKSRLVRHANVLGVLDMQLGTVLQAVGERRIGSKQEQETLHDLYAKQYAGDFDAKDRIDQESVAHLRELAAAGFFMDAELSAISGDMALLDNVQEGVSPEERPMALQAAIQSSQDRASLADHFGAVRIEDIGPNDPHPGRVLAFHGTAGPQFEKFNVEVSRDYGIHFGTAGQADFRISITDADKPSRIIPAVLDLRNVVTVPDLMVWDAVDVARSVEKAFPWLPGLGSEIEGIINRGGRTAPVLANDRLYTRMTEVGIDGLRYQNTVEGDGWSYMVWERGKVISATAGTPLFALGGGVDTASIDSSTGQSMRRSLDSLGYYSKALEAAEGLKQAKGTPEQMLAQLKKAGVKDAEIDATGLKSFLDGKKSVTKSEIVSHLEGNRVGLTEVSRGGGLPQAVLDEYASDLYGRPYDELSPNEQRSFSRDVYHPEDGEGRRDTRYSSYSLDPFNPTYRETVLHLPEWGNKPSFEVFVQMGGWAFDEFTPQEKADLRSDYESGDWARHLSGGRNVEAFRSGHFPEPNIVGHMMTSLVRHEGKPVFLIDQIQSDWGQKLRDGGVRDEAKIQELRSKIADLEAKATEEAKGWTVETVDDNRFTGQRTIKIRDESGRMKSQRSGFRGTDTEALAEAQRSAIAGDLRLLNAELSTVMAATPGNPLVNTTDQWVNITLRRAIRQAAEADVDYIAIPTGDTVLSYNPGDEKGMRGFYGSVNTEQHIVGIVPKNLRKLLAAIDKEAGVPVYTARVETPSSEMMSGDGFTLFPLTDAVKASVMDEGQPLFALSGGLPRDGEVAGARQPTPPGIARTAEGAADEDSSAPSLNAVIQKLKESLGVVPTQTLLGVTIKAEDGSQVRLNPRANVRGQMVASNAAVGVRKSRQLDVIAHEMAHTLEVTLGADILDFQQQNAAMLEAFAPGLTPSEQFADWFSYYITSGTDGALATTPSLVGAFEDVIEANAPEMLEGIHEAQALYADWLKRSTPEALSSDLVSRPYAENAWADLASPGSIALWLANAYTAMVGRNNPIWHVGRKLLEVADRNGVRDPSDPDRPISLGIHEDPYKIARSFAGSYAMGYAWLTKGIAREGEQTVSHRPLSEALETLFGSTNYKDWVKNNPKTWQQWKESGDFLNPVALLKSVVDRQANSMYQVGGQYLVSQAAIARYEIMEQRDARIAEIEDVLARGAIARQRTAAARDKVRSTLERRQIALIRAETLMRDRSAALRAAEAEVRNLQERIQDKKDAVLASQMARDSASATRRQRELSNLERQSSAAVRATEALRDEYDALEIDVALLSAEIPQYREQLDLAERRVASVDQAVERLAREKDQTAKSGPARAPTKESKQWHQDFIAKVEADPKYKDIGKFAAMVRDFAYGMLVRKYEAGFITKEEFDKYASQKDWYVPMMRDMTDVTPEDAFFRNVSTGNWSPFKKFDGSDRAIINPLEILAQDAYATSKKIMRNKAANALADLAERAGPGSASIVQVLNRDESMEANAATFDKIKDTAMAMGISEEDATRIVHQLEEDYAGTTLQAIWSPAATGPDGRPTMPFYRNGERRMLRLTDTEFGGAAFQAFANLGAEQQTWLGKALAAPARFLTLMITSNPTFALALNIVRDIPTAWILTGAKPFVTQYRGLKGLKDENLMRQYMEAGGILGGRNVQMLTQQEQQLKVLEIAKDKPSAFSMVAGSVYGGFGGLAVGGPAGAILGAIAGGYAFSKFDVRKAADAIESMTRVGVAVHAYKEAMDNDPSLTPEQAMAAAAYRARAMFDWNDRGSKALAMTQQTAFLNAQARGLDAAVKALGGGDSPRGFVLIRHIRNVWDHERAVPLSKQDQEMLGESYKVIGRTLMLTALGTAMALVASSGDDDDEDRLRYEDIQDKTKSVRWWFPNFLNSGLDVKIAKPFEWALLGNFIEIALDDMRGRDVKSWDRMVDSAYGILAPPIVPQWVQLGAGLGMNVRLDEAPGVGKVAKRLLGRSPEEEPQRKVISDRLAAMDPESQVDAYTSQIAIDIVKGIAEIMPKDMVPSPKMVDFVIRTAGIWGSDAQKGYQAAKEAAGFERGPEASLSDYPVAGGFVGHAARQSKSKAELHRMMAKSGGVMVEAERGYKHRLDEQNDPKAAAQWLESLPNDERAYAILQYHGGASDKKSHPLNRALDIDIALSKVKADTLMNRLTPTVTIGGKKKRNFEEKIDLTPQQKREVIDISTRLQQAEAWNSMVLLGRPGWEGKKEFKTQPLLDQLKASSPQVFELYEFILQEKKVRDFSDIKSEWPDLRSRILREGVDAF